MEYTENQEPTTENPTPEVNETEQTTDNTTEEQTQETDKSAEETAIWQDKYMRLSAEFDNFRKRTAKEKMELVESGGERVIKAFLVIADDMERAIKVLPEGAEREGMELVYKKFIDTLRSQKVTTIEALGQPLDVDFHDAIANFPTGDESKAGMVIDVVQTGYMLGDKVLRHAKVVVGE